MPSPSSPSPHTLAILGAGPVGVSLATRLVTIGHTVTISSTHSPTSPSLRLAALTAGATPLTVPAALPSADIIVLAVPLRAIPELAPLIAAHAPPSAIVLDAGNYYPARDGRIPLLDAGAPDSAYVAETLARPVVKAFNSIIAAHIASHARGPGARGRVAMPVAGDDAAAVEVVMRLVEAVGFDAYNAGPLAESWRQQAGQPAYCTEAGVVELEGLLARAEREGAGGRRDRARELVERLPEGFDTEVLLRVARLGAGLGWWSPRSWWAGVVLGGVLLRGGRK